MKSTFSLLLLVMLSLFTALAFASGTPVAGATAEASGGFGTFLLVVLFVLIVALFLVRRRRASSENGDAIGDGGGGKVPRPPQEQR